MWVGLGSGIAFLLRGTWSGITLYWTGGGVTPMSIGYCLGVGRLYEERAPSGSDERTQVHLEKVPEERGPWGLSHGTPKNVPGSGYGLWSSYAVVFGDRERWIRA